MAQKEAPPAKVSQNTVDFLDEDVVTVNGQKFALLCVVSPEQIEGQPKGSGKVAVKIRGCFDTQEQARHQAAKVHKADSSVTTYCVDMYKWLLVPPEDDKIGETVYGEDFLQKLFKGYEHSRKVAKQAFNKRVDDVKTEGLDKHLLPSERQTKTDLKPEDFRVGSVMPDVDVDPLARLKPS